MGDDFAVAGADENDVLGGKLQARDVAILDFDGPVDIFESGVEQSDFVLELSEHEELLVLVVVKKIIEINLKFE